MQTTHRIAFSPAQQMEQVEEGSVHLTVTSPPYPMVDMWDSLETTRLAYL